MSAMHVMDRKRDVCLRCGMPMLEIVNLQHSECGGGPIPVREWLIGTTIVQEFVVPRCEAA
jgi:hypothetical protein